MKGRCSILGIAMVLAAANSVRAEAPNDAMLAALRPFHALVGDWKGTGNSFKSPIWNETLQVTWGFRESDGRVSINFYADGSTLFKAGLLTFNPETKTYLFVAKDKDDKILRFEGKPSGEQSIRLDRKEKQGNDSLDRLDIMLVRSGDKLRYVFSKLKGKSFYESYATTEHFREGESLEKFKSGPRCIVTGGAGRIAVEHEGTTYHVACPNSKEEFLNHPDRYLKKSKEPEKTEKAE